MQPRVSTGLQLAMRVFLFPPPGLLTTDGSLAQSREAFPLEELSESPPANEDRVLLRVE